MTRLLSDRIFPSPQPQGQPSLADALRRYPVRQSARTVLAQCLAPQKQTYELLSVGMDLETKLALDRGKTISVWRCR